MPLSEPAPRKLLHTRKIECCGYERDDGLWDIEAHMTDVKTYNFPNQDRGGEVTAGEPLHGMWLRLTVDMNLLVHAAEAVTDWSPFKLCPAIAQRYQDLVGLRIGPGWNLKVRQLFKGVAGCTHLTDLLGPMATVALQTIHPRRRKERQPKSGDLETPRIINSCHALASDSPVVKQHWPHYYTGPVKQVVNE